MEVIADFGNSGWRSLDPTRRGILDVYGLGILYKPYCSV